MKLDSFGDLMVLQHFIYFEPKIDFVIEVTYLYFPPPHPTTNL